MQRVVESWPRHFVSERATALGFAAEQTFDQIIDLYLAENGLA